MSSFWSIWITVITLGSIFGSWWLLQTTRRAWNPPADPDKVPHTGHVYDGIEELDNPIPYWWYLKYLALIVFALGYLALYPGLGNYQGLLGWTQESAWEEELAEAKERYSPIFAEYAKTSIPELQSNKKAMLSAQRIFANNCAVCHGEAAKGGIGFPNLTDDDWLYGGKPEDIKTTLIAGRKGQMPAWSAILGEEGVRETAEYVISLSDSRVIPELAKKGEKHFKAMCTACHGPDGKGNQALGAPNLTDNIWLYGGSPEAIRHTLRNGRNGNMPAHLELLGEDKIHLMTAYIHGLSLKETAEPRQVSPRASQIVKPIP